MVKECNTSDVVLKDKIPKGKTASRGGVSVCGEIRMLREAGQTEYDFFCCLYLLFPDGGKTTIDFM